MYLSRILAALVCLNAMACSPASEVTMPCPRPAFVLSPQLDTIAVGATLQYETAFPNSQPVPQSRLQWSSSDAQRVSVDQGGLATARARGVVEIHALDPNSAPTCPDQWSGNLVVQ